MNLKSAILYLNNSTRFEAAGEELGSLVVSWYKDGEEIANGSFSDDDADVLVKFIGTDSIFKDREALVLLECGDANVAIS